MAQKNSREHASEAGKKEWHAPVLNKLPIAATAGTKTQGNEGGGGGKGDAGPPSAS
jgi:hypothetical protein